MAWLVLLLLYPCYWALLEQVGCDLSLYFVCISHTHWLSYPLCRYILSGWVYDTTEKFEVVYGVCGILYIISGLLIAIPQIIKHRKSG